METLPDKYRAALELHFIEEYTISQTAEILGENVSTVKQRLVRGKKLLASKLEKKNAINKQPAQAGIFYFRLFAQQMEVRVLLRKISDLRYNFTNLIPKC